MLDIKGKKVSMSQNDVDKVLKAFIEEVHVILGNKDEIRLPSLGTSTTSFRKATTGRNPRTGEEIKISARYAAKFTPAKALKDTLCKIKVK